MIFSTVKVCNKEKWCRNLKGKKGILVEFRLMGDTSFFSRHVKKKHTFKQNGVFLFKQVLENKLNLNF